MINRELIRIKVVQLVYAFQQQDDRTLKNVENELAFRLAKTYDLYKYILTLLIEVKRMAERKEEARILRAQRLGIAAHDNSNDKVLAENLLLKQLAENEFLLNYIEHEKKAWHDEDIIVKQLYNAFVEHDIFSNYIDRGDFSYAADNELIRRLYKAVVANSEIFDNSIEEQSIYWNDDKISIDNFIVKTLFQFTEETKPDHELYPQFMDEADRQFAMRLITEAVARRDELQQFIKEQSKTWDFERIALMDVVIMQTALVEMLTFSDIPVGVSINEYVELAKYYSTPRSASFINGMLDGIAKRLRAEGLLLKSISRAKK
jgi:N utilization substance protein B